MIWLLWCKSALKPNLGEKKKHDANCTHERRDERSNCVGKSSASGSVIYLPVFPSVAAGEPRCRRCGGLDSGPLGWRRGRGITKRTRDLRPDWLNTWTNYGRRASHPFSNSAKRAARTPGRTSALRAPMPIIALMHVPHVRPFAFDRTRMQAVFFFLKKKREMLFDYETRINFLL